MSKDNPVGPLNIYSYFISKNPATSFNPQSVYPTISKSAFVGPFSSVIGDVRICDDVFIGCNATLRADEGTPFFIGEKSNIQDGVILHGLNNMRFCVNQKEYSIYIGSRVSIAHGALIHGPCIIGNNTFVGFNSIVFNSIVEDGCYIDFGAIITNGVRIHRNRYVPVGAIIDTQEKANALRMVTQDNINFNNGVVKTNVELSSSYAISLGDTRCSCGVCCNHDTYTNLKE